MVGGVGGGSASGSGGGGLWSGGGTAVTTSTFSGDTATINPGAFRNGGGGIYSGGGALGLTDSTVSTDRVFLTLTGLVNNGGGGVYNAGTTTAMLNSTLSANTVTATGSGTNEAGGGALYDFGTGGTIASTTITGNSVVFPGTIAAAFGGGIYEAGASGTMTLHNSILAANSVAGGVPLGANCETDGGITISSLGHNIESANTCGLSASGDQVNTNPLVGPLQDNGGPAFTEALLPGSPAINRGDSTGCPATDERGVSRPQPAGGVCDIGAYEVGVADLALTATAAPNPVPVGGRLTYSAKVVNAGGVPTNATLRASLPTRVTFVSATSSQGSCAHTGSTVSCALGALKAGASAQATIVVSPRASGHVASTINVGSSDPDPTPANNTRTLTVTVGSAPVLSTVKQSAKRWLEGKALAHLSKAKPAVGTTFSFKLSASARVKLVFTQRTPGRKAGKKCVARTAKNKTKHRCTRSIRRGTLSFNAHQGTDKLRFQGRLSRKSKLPLGSYTVTITATNTVGQRSRPHSLSFTIIKK
jgi:uncharacterized repeat protein (TIGR01451 family)